jgi:hypothetical protein
MSNKMNDFVLQQLQAENEKLKRELESSKNAIKVSEAIKTLVEYIDKKNTEPFDPKNYPNCDNPFLKSQSKCL